MDGTLVETLVKEVIERLHMEESNDKNVPIEASGRHVHLSTKDVEKLFGLGHRLTFKRELSQPNQFLCEERVTLIGPKGVLRNVAVLGPERKNTQVEVSKSDAVALGVEVPIKVSGDISGTPSIIIASPKHAITVDQGLIIAKRHIHMPEEKAQAYNVKDHQLVTVKVYSDRPIVFEDVLIRVDKKYKLSMHIDYDEANACNHTKGVMGRILTKKGEY